MTVTFRVGGCKQNTTIGYRRQVSTSHFAPPFPWSLEEVTETLERLMAKPCAPGQGFPGAARGHSPHPSGNISSSLRHSKTISFKWEDTSVHLSRIFVAGDVVRFVKTAFTFHV